MFNPTPKLKIIFSIILIAVFAIANFAFAQVDIQPELGATFGLTTQELQPIIVNIVNIALGFLGVIAVSVILYGGFIWMTSGGIPEKIIQARKILINGVIGLTIILLSFAITQFIFRSVYGPGGVPTGPGGDSSGSGALGAGIIESVYPAPGARDVVRNTSIVVTFKEDMDANTIITDTNGSGTLGDWIDNSPANGLMDAGEYDTITIGGAGEPNIQISKQSDFGTGPYVTEVFATTLDNKTFVFKPVQLLGSPSENTWYTTKLTSDINKADGSPAFGALGEFFWSFEISTEVDVTPPYITNVQPVAGGTYAKNVVIQIQFSEAINPLSVLSNNITVSGSVTGVTVGALNISNQYRTVEFLGSPCGVNSCNETIYCLPGGEAITATVRAADCDGVGGCPQAAIPFDGIVDMAFNSLDGNNNGIAEGLVDDYSWNFNTTNNIELTEPTINSVAPSSGDLGVGLSNPIEILFSELMMSSSLKAGNIDILSPPVDYWITNENILGTPDQTIAFINHSKFNVITNYKPQVTSGVKDLYQNCLFPSASATCAATVAQPYCCEDVPSAAPCP